MTNPTLPALRRAPIRVGLQRLSEDAGMPVQATPGDAGYDLYALKGGYLAAGERQLFRTGIALSIPHGFVGLIWPRSGLANRHGLDVLAGVIDAGYRGDVGVILLNTGQEPVEILPGERIAQLLLQPAMEAMFEEVDELDASLRGVGGFGSTGIY